VGKTPDFRSSRNLLGSRTTVYAAVATLIATIIVYSTTNPTTTRPLGPYDHAVDSIISITRPHVVLMAARLGSIRMERKNVSLVRMCFCRPPMKNHLDETRSPRLIPLTLMKMSIYTAGGDAAVPLLPSGAPAGSAIYRYGSCPWASATLYCGCIQGRCCLVALRALFLHCPRRLPDSVVRFVLQRPDRHVGPTSARHL